MRILSRFCLLALCLSAPLYAGTHSQSAGLQKLQVDIDALLQKRSPRSEEADLVLTGRLLTPVSQLASLCANPALSLPGNDSRLTGKRSVIAQCGSRKFFIQVQVKAQGTWWVAKRPLSAGTVVHPGDIEARSGVVERSLKGLIFTPNEIIGQTLTRAVPAGQPLLASQLRQRWQLRAGQQVDVVTTGDGFRIRSSAKALGNAAVDDTLRVQTRNGQILSGKVNAAGQVMVFLRE
ncbi:flagellar basal body P-ring formation chaperone FlgA [Cedecea sp.]|jgi:flagella basal body P-ring formation protein FlgA|uniref:flagellar basal body P-ring formation chaperone FlgA n=1 Tax=Cedecea sp. TaxID=1970739 RepID=UPI002F4018AF